MKKKTAQAKLLPLSRLFQEATTRTASKHIQQALTELRLATQTLEGDKRNQVQEITECLQRVL